MAHLKVLYRKNFCIIIAFSFDFFNTNNAINSIEASNLYSLIKSVLSVIYFSDSCNVCDQSSTNYCHFECRAIGFSKSVRKLIGFCSLHRPWYIASFYIQCWCRALALFSSWIVFTRGSHFILRRLHLSLSAKNLYSHGTIFIKL